ncbi:MAG: sulfotransferase, partial [Sinobacteraceae bacterium]|nr:sulfotransferase [Nevskiaceae bacterium]
KRLGGRYDAPGLTALVDRITQLGNEAFVRQHRAHAPRADTPIFIIGMPRSGTSLMEQILASHPAVFGAGEIRFWDRRLAGLPAQSELPQIEHELASAASDYLGLLRAQAPQAGHVTDKMPANFLYAGLIHAALPGARFIHMQRHPLDTCLSVYFQNFFSVSPYARDLQDLAHYYGEYQRSMQHWRRVLPAEVLLEVPYEGLVDDLQGWTRRVLEFLGLPWDARCLAFHETARTVLTASKWQVRQQVNRRSVGRWRNYEQYLGPLRQLVL